jgi:hypothetical protein
MLYERQDKHHTAAAILFHHREFREDPFWATVTLCFVVEIAVFTLRCRTRLCVDLLAVRPKPDAPLARIKAIISKDSHLLFLAGFRWTLSWLGCRVRAGHVAFFLGPNERKLSRQDKTAGELDPVQLLLKHGRDDWEAGKDWLTLTRQ